jgi:dipeptidyl aminopeptidase/acylaminoacyl peptidase
MTGENKEQFTGPGVAAVYWRRGRYAVIVGLLSVLTALMTLSLSASAADLATLSPAEEQALADYGELPAFEHVALSPDGSRLAYVGTSGDEQHVVVKNLADGRKLIDFTPSPQKIRGVLWADSNFAIALVSVTTPGWAPGQDRDEFYGVLAADLDKHQVWDVLKHPAGGTSVYYHYDILNGRLRAREVDGQTSLFVAGYFDPGFAGGQDRGRFAVINLATRVRKVLVARDFWTQYSTLLDERGNVVAAGEYHDKDQSWQIQVGRDGHLQEALSGGSQIRAPDLQGISPDGHEVWLVTWNDHKAVPISISLDDGKPTSSTALRAGLHRADWKSVLLDTRNDRVLAGVLGETMTAPTYEFLDPEIDLRWQKVLKALAGRRPTIESQSDDFGAIVVKVAGPGGPEHWMVDTVSGKVARLGPVYRHLPAVASVQDIEYTAGDGLTIPGFLTLPIGRPNQKLPLVVLPHGGPQTRDIGGFDWWAQALAYEGYAVLQPNYRGSSVSQDHVKAGAGEWGRKMQTDLSDGVSYLATLGIIDPKRVCIVGASYGGYAALAGVSLQHGIYRCAVSVAGISDLGEWLKHSKNEAYLHYNESWLGAKNERAAVITERSPRNHADDIDVPVLLIHGRDDEIVPYDQSSRMAAALKSLDKPFEMVDLKAEDHWLSHGPTRLQMLKATVAFLKANNPPDVSTVH